MTKSLVKPHADSIHLLPQNSLHPPECLDATGPASTPDHRLACRRTRTGSLISLPARYALSTLACTLLPLSLPLTLSLSLPLRLTAAALLTARATHHLH